MKEIGSDMNCGSTHPLSIKYSGDSLALARRLQEYVAFLVAFAWRHQQENTDLWKNFTSSKYSSTELVQESAAQADQLF
jgi:hypothetical protein